MLLAAKADTNKANACGSTALHYAAGGNTGQALATALKALQEGVVTFLAI